MKHSRKFGAILGVKGVLCLASLTMVALALVTYPATVTITPTQQFTIGATSDSWTVYVNDANEVRYLPGVAAEPTLNTSDANTYAFRLVTDAQRNCSVKIELTSAVNSSKFSTFQISVRSSTGGAWADEPLYTGATGSATKSHIDGLTPGDAAYIHQSGSTTRYYLIKVIYSYDIVDETTSVTVNTQYTPLPQGSLE